MTQVAELARSVLAGDRRALSKAITLVESSRETDRTQARQLLALLGSASSGGLRVGVTGVPGAGKSTLLDALGATAIAAGERVAVLAIDPTSRESGGSLLGDKTRMSRLAVDPAAFVRPSPTRGVLGGTAGRTREAIALCEAAGYGVTFVETVGVGQSEETVAGMVDCVLLVLLAGAGDELSSMKRGVLEVADVIAFNKADSGQQAAVEADAAGLRSSLTIMRAHGAPPVLVISARHGDGIESLWQTLVQLRDSARLNGAFAQRRARQRRAWFDSAFEETLRQSLAERLDLVAARDAAVQRVETGLAEPLEAAQRLVAELLPTRARSRQ